MTIHRLARLALVLVLGAAAAPAAAFDWSYSPLTAIASGPSGPPSAVIVVEPHYGPSTAIRVHAPVDVAVEDNQWVKLGLQMPMGQPIELVEICYQVLGSTGESGIYSTRLTEMTTPDAAWVIADDVTPHTSTTATCYETGVGSSTAGTITLELRVALYEGEQILIGMVRLVG